MARATARTHDRRRTPAAISIGFIAGLLVVTAAAVFLRDTGPGRSAVPSPTASSAFCTEAGPATKGKKAFPSEPCTVIDAKTKIYFATMKTSMGEIHVVVDPKLAPRTVNNFVFLAEQGFYDNTTFHLVKNVVDPDPKKDHAIVQGGDPSGTGAGGPGYTYGEPPPPITRYQRGNIVMARKKQPNSNGSQFFFVVRDWEELEPDYTFFGVVTDEESMAVLDRMVETEGRALPGDVGFTPEPPIRLLSVTIDSQDRF